MTRQEMFDKAVRGLASQHWAQASKGDTCVYDDGEGKHCAWGWIDQDSWPLSGLIRELRVNQATAAVDSCEVPLTWVYRVIRLRV